MNVTTTYPISTGKSRQLVKSLPLEPDKWMKKENPRSNCFFTENSSEVLA